MPTRLIIVAGLLACLLTAGGCRTPGADAPSFRIGYMICNSLEETRARFDPLTAYLEEATGANFEPVYLDTADFEEAFEAGGLDFTHTNSLLYITLAERHGLKLLAAEKRGAYGALTRGTIIVRKDSPVRTLADLKGKRLIFGPEWAPYGFLAQYAMLLDAGVDPEKDLGPYGFPRGTWKHEKILYAVLYGAYDAGTAPLIDLEEMTAEGKVSPDDFRIVAQSGLGPYCTVGAASRVEKVWADKVRDALLAVNERTVARIGGETRNVQTAAKVDGFEALADADYGVLHEWAKKSRLPPYEKTSWVK